MGVVIGDGGKTIGAVKGLSSSYKTGANGLAYLYYHGRIRSIKAESLVYCPYQLLALSPSYIAHGSILTHASPFRFPILYSRLSFLLPHSVFFTIHYSPLISHHLFFPSSANRHLFKSPNQSFPPRLSALSAGPLCPPSTINHQPSTARCHQLIR